MMRDATSVFLAFCAHTTYRGSDVHGEAVVQDPCRSVHVGCDAICGDCEWSTRRVEVNQPYAPGRGGVASQVSVANSGPKALRSVVGRSGALRANVGIRVGPKPSQWLAPRPSSSSWGSPGADGQRCGIRTDHSSWCSGDNFDGALGLGNTVDRFIPHRLSSGWTNITVGFFHTCGIRTDGSLWCWGDNASELRPRKWCLIPLLCVAS
jgi:hypothetical protein